jgi:hypothetical protein
MVPEAGIRLPGKAPFTGFFIGLADTALACRYAVKVEVWM